MGELADDHEVLSQAFRFLAAFLDLSQCDIPLQTEAELLYEEFVGTFGHRFRAGRNRGSLGCSETKRFQRSFHFRKILAHLDAFVFGVFIFSIVPTGESLRYPITGAFPNSQAHLGESSKSQFPFEQRN